MDNNLAEVVDELNQASSGVVSAEETSAETAVETANENNVLFLKTVRKNLAAASEKVAQCPHRNFEDFSVTAEVFDAIFTLGVEHALSNMLNISPTPELTANKYNALVAASAASTTGDYTEWNTFGQRVRDSLVRYGYVEMVESKPTVTESGFAAISAFLAVNVMADRKLSEKQLVALQAALDHDVVGWSPAKSGRTVSSMLTSGFVVMHGQYPVLTEKGQALATAYKLVPSAKFQELPENTVPTAIVKRVNLSEKQRQALAIAISGNAGLWMAIRSDTRSALVAQKFVAEHTDGTPEVSPEGLAVAAMNGINPAGIAPSRRPLPATIV